MKTLLSLLLVICLFSNAVHANDDDFCPCCNGGCLTVPQARL